MTHKINLYLFFYLFLFLGPTWSFNLVFLLKAPNTQFSTSVNNSFCVVRDLTKPVLGFVKKAWLCWTLQYTPLKSPPDTLLILICPCNKSRHWLIGIKADLISHTGTETKSQQFESLFHRCFHLLGNTCVYLSVVTLILTCWGFSTIGLTFKWLLG